MMRELTSNVTATPKMFRWDDGDLGRVFKIAKAAKGYSIPGSFELTMAGLGTSSFQICKEQAIDLLTGLQAWIEQLEGGE